MRQRAYRPGVCDCLEHRSLLSGVAGPSAEPVVLPRLLLNRAIDRMRLEFGVFARDRDHSHYHDDKGLRDDLRDVAAVIPYGQVDGLGVAINGILDRMQEDLAANDPHAIGSALNATLAVTRADLQARVRSGSVVVR